MPALFTAYLKSLTQLGWNSLRFRDNPSERLREGERKKVKDYEKMMKNWVTCCRKAVFRLCFNIGKEHKSRLQSSDDLSGSNNEGKKLLQCLIQLRLHAIALEQLKNKTAMPKRQTNGGPCKFSVWLDPIQLASVAHCHCITTLEKRRWAEEKPSHLSCVRMRPEVEPIFCSLPGREPTIPTWRHLSPAVHIAQLA